MKKIIILMVILFILYWLGTMTVPGIIDKSNNPVKESAFYEVSDIAMQLYQSLDFVADLHCDAILWGRNLTQRADFGHVDFPRMQEALLQEGFTEAEIRAIMGENVKRFLLENL